jgi:hypothetical protein
MIMRQKRCDILDVIVTKSEAPPIIIATSLIHPTHSNVHHHVMLKHLTGVRLRATKVEGN